MINEPQPSAEEEPHSAGAEVSVAEALPELARAAADAWVRTAWWGLAVSMRVGTRLARVALDRAVAIELAEQFSAGMRSYAREFLGVADLDDRVRQLAPPPGALSRRNGRHDGVEPKPLSLRAQGAELLRQAADVDAQDDIHPAYARILAELAPDEARVLRLLAVDGPQPAVDVRAVNLIGVGSQLVAPGLNMLGAQAGLRHRERVPAYLNNLVRLGLIQIAGEPVADPILYQVLEAQPGVLTRLRETTRARIDRRSIHLSDFGLDFCRVCLPSDSTEVEALGVERSA